MPISELEFHPHLNYFQNRSYDRNAINRLIIGTFPIYQVTDSVNEDFEIYERRDNNRETNMKFFYGSRKSKFWSYLSSIYSSPDFFNNEMIDRDQKRNCAINLLFENNILITDTIKKTNRFELSSDDKDLMYERGASDWIIDNFEFNLDIIDLLKSHPEIKSLYFTSIIENGISSYGIFKKIFFDHEFIEREHFCPNGKNWAKVISIDGRYYNIFFLPTPKERTISFSENRQHPLFVNYLNSIGGINFVNRVIFPLEAETKSQIQSFRKDFLVETFKQALVYNNLHYNGFVF
jgi:hypothetical protein